MRRYAALLAPFWLGACLAQAQDRGQGVSLSPGAALVFTVVGHDCRGREMRQSGFQATVDNAVGIVTPLHGVVGCRTVDAEGAEGENAERVRNLEVARVDVARDLAFLTSETLRPDRTRRVGAMAPPVSTTSIASRLAPSALALLADRRSPSPGTLVFDVSQPLTPFEFGRPLLDTEGVTVAVVNGVDQSPGVIAWAIPWQDLEWLPPVQNETAMDRLAALTTPLW